MGSREHPDVKRRALQAHRLEERDLLEAMTSEMNRPVLPPPGSPGNPLVVGPGLARAIRSEFPDVHVAENELIPPSRGWR